MRGGYDVRDGGGGAYWGRPDQRAARSRPTNALRAHLSRPSANFNAPEDTERVALLCLSGTSETATCPRTPLMIRHCRSPATEHHATTTLSEYPRLMKSGHHGSPSTTPGHHSAVKVEVGTFQRVIVRPLEFPYPS